MLRILQTRLLETKSYAVLTMETVPIYSWNPKSLWPGQARNPFARLNWSVGNFGDLYNFDLVRYLYGVEARNKVHGSKMLFVGSTLHRAQKGDSVTGVGAKSQDKPINCLSTDIVGLRGQLSQALAEAQLGKLQNLRFLGDPGGIASDVYGQSDVAEIKHGVTVIPHYRDYKIWRDMGFPAEKMVSPDNEPRFVYERIASSVAVVTSSLHGLVFANSAGIPVTLVRPLSEPFFKYEDYLSAMTGDAPEIISVEYALRNLDSLSGAIGTLDKDSIRNGLPTKGNVEKFLRS